MRLRIWFACALFCSLQGAASAQVRDRPLKEGDRILVKLWMDTVFADSARVQAQGTVILPRVGPISIEGVPASRVADSVRSAYSRNFRALTVEASPLRKIIVMGDVRRPAVYYLEPQSTLREAIAMAGGILEIGRVGRITVLRDSMRLSMKDWRTDGSDRAAIQSGDVLFIEREPWLKRNAFTVISSTSVLLSIYITLRQLQQ